MTATGAYQAAPETDDVVLSYAVESNWGVTPSVQFQALRTTGESLSPTKERIRPGELNNSGEVAGSVTARVRAGGQINFALSYGTYDDLMSIVMGADWQAAQAINGSSGDITITNISGTSATLSSTTSNKFSTLAAGQWVRLLGFSNAGNNKPMRVTAKASNTSLTVSTPFAATVTETPSGAAAKVRYSNLINGPQFKSASLQKQLGSSLFLRYPGMFFPGMTLQGSVGQYMQGNFTAIAQTETKATSDWSTGAVLAAPSGRVHDAVAGFQGMLIGGSLVSVGLDSISINLTRNNADTSHAMGNAAAAGMRRGTLEAKGGAKLFFQSFTQYDLFTAETLNRIEFLTADPAGNIYVLGFLNGAFLNPRILAGGTGGSVYAEFDIEGNPQSAGGTFQIDRLPAS